jgi:hypothetical protein
MEANMAASSGLPARPITISRRRFGYRVNPGTFRVDLAFSEGETFVIRNRCGLSAEVTFPDNTVFDDKGNLVSRPCKIDSGAAHDRKFSVNVDYGDWFDYIVTILAAGIEASGHSRPDIEIVR